MPKLFRRPDGNFKRECIECGIEKNLDNSFYKSNLSIYDSKMLICKDCVKEIKGIEKIKDVLRMNDIVFIDDLWFRCNQNMAEYLKNLSLSQYKNLKWGDSYTPKNEFKDKVINTLKGEIDALTPKLKQTREDRDYGTYKNLINAYKEVLNLLNDYNRRYEIKPVSNIKEKIAYVDISILQDTQRIKINIYCGNFIYILNDPNLSMIDYAVSIKNIFKNDDYVILYIDAQGFGRSLYDILKAEKGFDVRVLNIHKPLCKTI